MSSSPAQPTLFDGRSTPPRPHFDGPEYRPEDQARLSDQFARVIDVMKDQVWRTYAEIGEEIFRRWGKQYPETSISAQLRHARKPRFGAYVVDRAKRVKSKGRGLFEFRVRPHGSEPYNTKSKPRRARITELEQLVRTLRQQNAELQQRLERMGAPGSPPSPSVGTPATPGSLASAGLSGGAK